MRRYLKLVNFEFNRIGRLYAVILAIVIVSQIAGVIVQARSYLKEADHMINEEMMSQTKFLQEYGHLSMVQIIESYWFIAPIMLAIVAIAIYIFLTWYRDWFGKNTFIYRLLMLPTSRLNIFWAKLTNILLMTFGFVGLQLILLPVENMIFKLMVPISFRLDMIASEILLNVREFNIIIPFYFWDFLIYYAGGLIAVTVVFTAIVLERSFRWKGILAGGIYAACSVFVFMAPILIQEAFLGMDFFYPLELVGLEVLMGIIIFICSVWMSGWLLKSKIRV